MKLSELKPGMLVTREGYQDSRPNEVTAVGKFAILLVVNGQEVIDHHQDGWIIVEPRKKPSERIREIYNSYPEIMNAWLARFDAILEYLDEQSGLK